MQASYSASMAEAVFLNGCLDERDGCSAGDEVEAQQGPGEPERTDYFNMYCLKVVPCAKRFTHDWTSCPYAHLGERAARRDPRCHSYTGIACTSMKQEGTCSLGDRCPYAHSAWEYWLHPTRYHTEICKQGMGCNRKICFFAHRPEELRKPLVRPGVCPEAMVISTLTGMTTPGTAGMTTLGVPTPPPRRLRKPPPPALPSPTSLFAGRGCAASPGTGVFEPARPLPAAPTPQPAGIASDAVAATLFASLRGSYGRSPGGQAGQLLQDSAAVSSGSPTGVLSRLGSAESFPQEQLPTIFPPPAPAPPLDFHGLQADPGMGGVKLAGEATGGGFAAHGLLGASSGLAGMGLGVSGQKNASPLPQIAMGVDASGSPIGTVQAVMSLIREEAITAAQAAEILTVVLPPDALLQLQVLLQHY